VVTAGRYRRHRRVGALLLIVGLALAGAGCGSSKPDTNAKVTDIADSISRPLDRFSSAIESARPSDRRSIVELKATAARTSDALTGARRDLGDLEDSADGGDRVKVRDFESTLDDYQALADELDRAPLSPTSIEAAAERARQAGRDSRAALPTIDATALVAGLRRRGKNPLTAGGLSAPVGGGSSSSGAAVSYRKYTGPAFQARLPTGPGWGEPSQSEPNPGQLFRTNVRGPNGLFVIIDFTPLETAKFGSGYDSKTDVGQTAFGSATRYVFRGGRIPECQSTTCTDYIINGGGTSGGSGFAVLAGGGDSAAAGQIAQAVAESVTPVGQYDE
jgi:hypothetical protein